MFYFSKWSLYFFQIAPYFGTSCDLELNSCKNNSCQNNSTCFSVTINEYYCICPLAIKLIDQISQNGYSGKFCEKINEPCKPDPCFNGGECFTFSNGKQYCDCNGNKSHRDI